MNAKQRNGLVEVKFLFPHSAGADRAAWLMWTHKLFRCELQTTVMHVCLIKSLGVDLSSSRWKKSVLVENFRTRGECLTKGKHFPMLS